MFRGIMLTHFRLRLTPWRANLLQAAIFGLWHIAWPIQHYLTGEADAAGALSEAVTMVIASAISGLAYGYLYLKTNSLWAPWLGHTVNNTILNLTHLRTVGGLDADLMVRNVTMLAGFLLILPWIAAWAKRLQLPQLTPWGAPAKLQKFPATRTRLLVETAWSGPAVPTAASGCSRETAGAGSARWPVPANSAWDPSCGPRGRAVSGATRASIDGAGFPRSR